VKKLIQNTESVISGFRRDVNEIWAFVRYYAAKSGNSVLTFRDNLTVPSSEVKKSQTLKYWTARLLRNVGNELTLFAA
jgi:hypothetical protein